MDNMNKSDLVLNAGRLLDTDGIEVYSLKELDLKSRLDSVIEMMQGYYVVFDIDGTLCRFKYTSKDSDSLLPCKDKDLNSYLSYENNMYKYAEPILTMQYVVSKLDPDMLGTLSTAVPMAVLLKREWLPNYYPRIKKSNYMWSNSDFEKLRYLQELSKKYKVLFIDDSYKTLLYVEERDKSIKLMHTSEFLL